MQSTSFLTRFMASSMAIILVLLVGDLAAQKRPLAFTVSGGVAYPVANEEFTRLWNTGLNLGLGFALPLREHLEAVVSVEANNMPLDDRNYLRGQNLFGDNNTVQEGSATVIALNLGSKYSFRRSRTGEALYTIFGATVAHSSAGDALVHTRKGSSDSSYVVKGESQSAFGLGAGLGLDVRLSPKSFLFFEARYTLLFTNNPAIHFIPLRMGISFR